MNDKIGNFGSGIGGPVQTTGNPNNPSFDPATNKNTTNAKIQELRGEPLWWITRDADDYCRELYERHYSCYRYRDGRRRTKFIGPGQYICLRTRDGNALFVWRKFKDNSGQDGINCAVFRNESAHQSSDLIRQADAIADFCWPGERHYTYVNAEKVKSRNPGYCFIVAGWRRCGVTKKRGLLILERPALQGEG